MLHLYLIRHGLKEKTDHDPALTAEGHLQAQRTGQYLQQFPIQRILASPMLRTQQTAGYISQALALPIETDARLKERMDFGEYDGTRAQFFAEWVESTNDRLYTPQAGESSFNTGKRIEHLVDELFAAESKNQGKRHIALVTHGGAIADFLRNVFEQEHLAPLMYDFPNGRDYFIGECSVTEVERHESGFTLHNLHCLTHLTADMPG